MACSDTAGETDEPGTLPHRDDSLILCFKLTRPVTRLVDGEGRKISVSSGPLKIALSLPIGEISRIEIGETGTTSELVWAGSAASAAQWVRVPAAAPNLRNLPPHDDRLNANLQLNPKILRPRTSVRRLHALKKPSSPALSARVCHVVRCAAPNGRMAWAGPAA
jgi:hypothetical protein